MRGATDPGVCAACGGERLTPFLELDDVPVNSVSLWRTREEALRCATGSIHLGFCANCGAICNLGFDPAAVQYDEHYDNSLQFSAAFRNYSNDLADYLINRHDLRGKTILDVGCGNCEFLALLCERGGNRGVGFDPSYIPGRVNITAGKGITVVPDYYSEHYSDYTADFIVCRHVLEHVPEPCAFLSTVRAALAGAGHGGVFFEVPNASFLFRCAKLWDIIYEHCFYYDHRALTLLFLTCGYDVLNLVERFERQYLAIEAQPLSGRRGVPRKQADARESLWQDVLRFSATYRASLEKWERTLAGMARECKRVVLWGAGAKGTIFLNMFRHLALEYIVDINPHKAGLHIPGTGQLVVGPAFLAGYRPDVVLIMNGNYRDEIERQLSAMRLAPQLITV